MEDELKKLIAQGKVIPFVGAGVSMGIKDTHGNSLFPSWTELLKSFIPCIQEKSKQNIIEALLADKPINYLEVSDKIKANLTISDFNKHLENTLKVDYNTIDKTTYQLPQSIWNLGSNLVITTNYDKSIRRCKYGILGYKKSP